MFSLTFENVLEVIRSVPCVVDLVIGLAVIGALRVVYLANRKRPGTTRLKGPSCGFFGAEKVIHEAPDRTAVYEAWKQEYGVAYEIPLMLGQRRIVLCDPKAVAHLFGRDSWSYVLTEADKVIIAKSIGKSVVWADGAAHQRQRRSLAPAFNSTSIRKLSSVFYDASHKLKLAWEAIIDAEGGGSTIIEVQNWMNQVSLDSIGLVGFSHDFASLDGKKSAVTAVFDFFDDFMQDSLYIGILLLLRRFPALFLIPINISGSMDEFHKSLEDISKTFFEKAKREKDEDPLDGKEGHSIIGMLIKTVKEESNTPVTKEELLALLMTLIIAAYDPVAASMTWALLELARHPDTQTRLREEILTFDGEPTYDQISKGFPYFDAVVHEVLRLHPTGSPDIIRTAKEDDIIPLSQPVRTKSGEVVHNIYVTRGTFITIPVGTVNRLEALWGADAKQFRPERWLETNAQARELQGYRHLVTFGDGPKACIGRVFAIAEIKTVLWVLVKNFVFEMRDGLDMEVVKAQGMLPTRPKFVGEDGAKIPLRVKRYGG